MKIAVFATKRIGTEVLRFITGEYKEHLKLIVGTLNLLPKIIL